MKNKQIINPLPQGTMLHGRAYSYVIGEALGQGTFGITYLARVQMQGALGSLNTEVKVAVKEFFMKEINGRDECTVTASGGSGLFVDYKKKFRAEAEHLARLKHQNIINVVESFEENNTVYYVMEYIDGGSLDDYISECGHLPEDVVRNYVTQTGGALQLMHQQKMLHLDLKPANIMRRKDGSLVLIDFGLSKQFDENGDPESTTSIGGGTPGYSPLEQMTYQRGDGFPATMDVYALGATAFKMLTGKRPPDASYILNLGFPRTAFANLSVSPSMLSVIEKAMSPIMVHRYPTVESMLASLNDGGDAVAPAEPDPEETIYNTNPNMVNGHEWVDLGLPSGTKWATMNVGAISPSDYGDYFAWGETSPKSSYTWENLTYCLDTVGDKFSKYVTDSEYGKVDGKKELDPSDDAAYVNWGSGWRMPSKTQQDELCEKCKWTWTTMGGHKGYKVVGPNGNSLFLPAAGYRHDSELNYVGSLGYYWSRSLYLYRRWNAYRLYFSSGYVYTDDYFRRNGQSVRAVLAH